MLENMAQGSFPLQHLSDRYHLDVNETFSDGFIAQVGGLNQQVFDIATSQHENNENGNTLPSSTQDSIDILLQHSNLSSLWTFMMDQFRETFIVSFPKSSASVAPTQSTTDLPPPSSQQSLESALPTPSPLPTRLSPLITAHYVSSSSGAKFIGSKSIIFNPSFLRSYLYDALAFWRGQRDPKGVLMSEAWKCRICEFRDECDWIKGRDDRAVRESMEKRESSRSHV
jgi:exonuclease V